MLAVYYNTNIFMYVLETRMLKECEFKPWVFWLHGIERLQEFLRIIDSFHETVSYTWDYAENQVSFLDVTICREVGGGISTVCFQSQLIHISTWIIGDVTQGM